MRIAIVFCIGCGVIRGQVPAPPVQPQAGTIQSNAVGGYVGGVVQSRVAYPVQSAPRPPVRPEDLCTLEGKVVSEATGEPIKKANLTLRLVPMLVRPPEGVMPPIPMMPVVYTTQTDAGGQFQFTNLEPGQYTLNAERPGFVTVLYGAQSRTQPARTLRLAAAEKFTGADFAMTPQAVIAGRVIDEDGDPMVGAQVSAMQPRYTGGIRQLMPGAGSSTNDQGEYRIFGLAPGRYYLSATTRQMMNRQGEDRPANGKPEEGYLTTYYPSATDMKAALALDAGAGMVLRGVDLQLRKTKTMRIEGRIVNPTASSQGMVMLQTVGGPPGAGPGRQPLRPDGKFEFRGIAPGTYKVLAGSTDAGVSYTGQQTVEVGSTNVENLTIHLRPPMELSGQLHAEDAGNLNLTTVRIGARPPGTGAMSYGFNGTNVMFGANANSPADAEGRFVLRNLTPDYYQFTVDGLPRGFYIKSIQSGSSEVLESGLDLTQGAAGPIRIVVSGRAAQLTGTVNDDKQAGVAQATVVVVPESAARRQQERFYLVSRTGPQGQYMVANVAPGKYKIYAWLDVEYGAWMDPDYLKAFESSAKDVNINPGDQQTVDLKPAVN